MAAAGVGTMNPNGNQPASSTLTWKFSLVPAVSQCTLAVFVPTQNALGTADYAIFTGNPAEPRNSVGTPGRVRTAGATSPAWHPAIAASAASARCS